jgi:membrane-associated phospholipid phosphatase
MRDVSRMSCSEIAGENDWSRVAVFWLGASLFAMMGMIAAAELGGLSIHLNWPATMTMLGIFSSLAIGHRYYRARPQDAQLGVALGTLCSIVVSGSAGGVISQVGQTFAFPTIDAWLAAADRHLGLSCVDLTAAMAAVPGLTLVLAVLYALSIPLILISVVALAFLGREQRAWELCAAFAFCMVVATVTSAIFPAVGAFEYLPVPADIQARLPNGAGDYHLEMFYQLRAASSYELNPFRLQGLVTFPSFHTAMALMTAAAWRDDRRLRWPMFLWNAAVIVSTVPLGGHYAIDLLGGLACWLLIFRWRAIGAWLSPLRRLRSPQVSPAA